MQMEGRKDFERGRKNERDTSSMLVMWVMMWWSKVRVRVGCQKLLGGRTGTKERERCSLVRLDGRKSRFGRHASVRERDGGCEEVEGE